MRGGKILSKHFMLPSVRLNLMVVGVDVLVLARILSTSSLSLCSSVGKIPSLKIYCNFSPFNVKICITNITETASKRCGESN